MFGIDDMALATVGGSIASGLLNNSAASSRQDDAQQFSAQQYATRYQTTVKDMEAAGLNPMLAYSNGPGNAPTSSAASSAGMPDLGSSLTAGRMASAQIANVAADTKNKEAQSQLIEAQAAQARASAWLQNSQIEQNDMHVKDLTAKLENNYWSSEVDRIRAVARELQSQYDLNVQKGLTEQQSRGLMYAQAAKLGAETTLLNMDIKAGQALDNLGRTARELKPAIDILRSLLTSRN